MERKRIQICGADRGHAAYVGEAEERGRKTAKTMAKPTPPRLMAWALANLKPSLR